MVCDAWRQTKARSRRRPDAAKKLPRAYAQNDPPRNELSTISHKSNEKSSGGDEKWFRNVLTGSQLKQFIDDVRNGKNPGNALIGMVSDSTKKKVKELTGIDVTKIILEGTSITHVDDQKHKLEADDIEKCVEVINNPIDTTLSPKKTAQGLDVVCFKGNINGIIYFLEVVHKNYDGWLSLKTAYRPKKASVVPQWSKDPGANVQNAPPPAST